jgi:hypothetical protein
MPQAAEQTAKERRKRAFSLLRSGLFYVLCVMAGLGLFDQKSALTVTMPIVTAFKFCIRHRKTGS